MQFFCIADEDTVRGFRLTGVAGRAVADAAQATDALAHAVEQPECGIVIITEKVASELRERVDALRLERTRPLIVEIPGPSGPMPGRRSLREIAQEAIGIKVDQESS